MNNFFKIKESNSTVKAEILAGLTTFFAMAYIVFVVPNQLAAGGATGWLVAEGASSSAMGHIWNSIFLASVLGAFIGTLLMALYARLPFAQACGMGLNSFFCTTFIAGAYFNGVDVIKGYQAGVVIVFISGMVFLLLSLTGIRSYIAKAMPDCLKKATPAGIGLFIAFIGFQNVGIIQTNKYTLVQLFDFHTAIKSGNYESLIPVVVTFAGFLIIAVLGKLNIKANVIIGILASMVLYYLLTFSMPIIKFETIGQTFGDFSKYGITSIFKAESWRNAFTGANIGGAFNAVMLIVTFCLVDMFDTLGTLYGTASQAGMLDEKGDPIRVEKAMMCDSIGTVSGAVMGTSTVTTYVESASGVAAGGRTGLTSLVTSGCFLLCLFVSPLASIIPSAATAPALIYVGVLMLNSFAKVDMEDLRSSVPAFLALIMMPLTYSIANGIGIGAIAYVLITLATGKFKKQDIVVSIIAALFVLKFVYITM